MRRILLAAVVILSVAACGKKKSEDSGAEPAAGDTARKPAGDEPKPAGDEPKPAGDEPKPAAGGADTATALARISAVKDKMCACTDAACGKALYEGEWRTVDAETEPARQDEATRTEFNKINDELMNCMINLK